MVHIVPIMIRCDCKNFPHVKALRHCYKKERSREKIRLDHCTVYLGAVMYLGKPAGAPVGDEALAAQLASMPN
ncbi:hypothetical protein SDC9_68355 [bioreactor metagenome]|uniref:Uncharacterized protein n=1 Tax=bioreactor metagenome TaxID=1076179 RepID=A0A644Y069_9ZZZZ